MQLAEQLANRFLELRRGKMRLKDRVGIVTGSGTGLGKAIIEAFANEGATAIVADVDFENALAVAEGIKKKGGKALAFKCNVASRDDVESMVKTVIENFGQIDILVNNAGIIRPAMLLKMTEEQWDQVINVHLKGSFNCLQAAARKMKERNYGRIINITSTAGVLGTIGQINYSSAKAGILGLTKSAAKELARYNILVNAVAPGAATKMTEVIRTDEKFKDQYLKKIPLGRWAEPEEIAPAMVFLASEESSYITGQIIAADGGMTIY